MAVDKHVLYEDIRVAAVADVSRPMQALVRTLDHKMIQLFLHLSVLHAKGSWFR